MSTFNDCVNLFSDKISANISQKKKITKFFDFLPTFAVTNISSRAKTAVSGT